MLRIDKQIKSLREQVGKLSDIAEKTNSTLGWAELPNTDRLLLGFQSIQITGILNKLQSNLVDLERKRPGVILDFEKISQEVNLGMMGLRTRAERMKDRAPEAIKPIIDDILNQINLCDDQEDKNDKFYQLSQLISNLK